MTMKGDVGQLGQLQISLEGQNIFDVEYIYGFVWSRGLQAKSMTSQRYRAAHKMADMRYYGNVMTTTRWRLYVTMETLWQQQDGGYALLWKHFLHLQQYSHRLNFNYFILFFFLKSSFRNSLP